MPGSKYTIGVDYGTLSGRAVVVDISNGNELGSAVFEYPNAVMDQVLNRTGEKLPPEWALQDPNDYVVATGETRSVRDLCKMAFALIDKNYEDYVVIDKEYLRPEELPFLKGDSSKFRHATGWLPKISFENMIEEMMKDWTDRLA